jgi:ubiquinone biosynthesis protein
VSNYIKDSLGPKAMAADLLATAKVLSRFGPHLPRLAEAALLRAATPEAPTPKKNWFSLRSLGLGLALGALAMWLMR